MLDKVAHHSYGSGHDGYGMHHDSYAMHEHEHEHEHAISVQNGHHHGHHGHHSSGMNVMATHSPHGASYAKNSRYSSLSGGGHGMKPSRVSHGYGGTMMSSGGNMMTSGGGNMMMSGGGNMMMGGGGTEYESSHHHHKVHAAPMKMRPMGYDHGSNFHSQTYNHESANYMGHGGGHHGAHWTLKGL